MNIEAYTSETIQPFIKKNSDRTKFLHFVLHDSKNRKLTLIAAVGALLQLVVFKSLYPFPDFISDSYSYIATNIYRMDVNLWPIGYSKFLLLSHIISPSDTFLIAIQYGILELTLLYFFFTITYLYQPSNKVKIGLFTFLLFNPMFLYLSNCILSDSTFTALSIIFLSQFLWMFHRPTKRQVLIQGLIIGLTFTIRYTAIYYPLVALTGLLMSTHKPIVKAWGMCIGLGLIVSFFSYTKQKTKNITGHAEFSVFGGWQLANNALYMYNYIKVDSSKLPIQTRSLDHFSKQLFKKIPPSDEELASLPGTYFIKVPWAILKPYMAHLYTYDDPPSQFEAWGKVSPIYKQYGIYLIKHHPFAFAKHYLWLNTKNYFLPHLEKFGTYNLEINTVPPDVQDWFEYTTPDVSSISATFQGKIFYVYPIIFMLLNITYGLYLLWIVLTGRLRKLSKQFKSTILLTTTFLLLNFGFSIFATPIVLRYQVIPMIILFTFSLVFLDNSGSQNKSQQLQTT